MHQALLIIDFGSQYTQLIARRVRELNVYCEIHPFNHLPTDIKRFQGIILSGGPASVRDLNAPEIPTMEFRGKYPVLGICYGAQLMAQQAGGNVMPSKTREYGRAHLSTTNGTPSLLKNVSASSQVWMSHGDTITEIPEGFEIIASTETVKVAAYKVHGEQTFGVQFHPEVVHSTEGKTLLSNFLFDVCGFTGDWTPGSYIEETVAQLKQQLGNDKVILGLSGGVDSGVAAVLLHRAIGKNLYCIFIDNGLLRKNEFQQVLDAYQHMGLQIKGVDASSHFYRELAGVSEPEQKRKIIGRVFIEEFDRQAHAIEDVKWLAQGTIYPDIIESVSVKGPSATIKSHHNVGGLPEKMKLKVVEPLKTLFKDEVRIIGTALGMASDLLNRHPFPGPGLGIRILGDITPEKVAIIQEVDAIFINGLKEHGLYDQVWQAGSILLPVKSVGVMGDERTYENVVSLRAVSSTDGMTADWVHLPYEFLGRMSNEIINNVKGVNRVVYDISSKPPATIEWE
ncbi:MAG: glutamine-hydrolyzing GMP synthase [Bacteroidetes bacterium]|jgi:GMP synthase (glutamine-hydrolysing)|nr:glutamine-hydrolyzing GMP synthase [Bacteroidota bacterium]MBK8876401.1 glutamine-hydrolyzing GMP synthase [Bacteroidota bacterium]MBK9423587.1 glutamine-hydrolyzing GMP synthase [Bacteroidota bacterium]